MTRAFFRDLPTSAQNLLESLDTVEKIQQFVDQKLTYDPYREDRSLVQIIEDKRAECYNGALFAAACLIFHGYEAFLVELLARDDEEHILCVYKEGSRLGALAQSKFLGLKGRKPMYHSVRDLAASYLEFYFAFDGHYSLTSFTELFDISTSNAWLTQSDPVVSISKALRDMPHETLAHENDPVFYVSPDRFWRETLVIPEGTVIPDHYLEYKKRI